MDTEFLVVKPEAKVLSTFIELGMRTGESWEVVSESSGSIKDG
jgi:hypothetical protein